MRDEIVKRKGELAIVSQANSDRLAEVERSIRDLELFHNRPDDEDDDEDQESAETQLSEEAKALKAGQVLLPALLAHLSSGRFEEMARQNRSTNTNVSFGNQNSGFQIGVNDGNISGVTIGRQSS